MYVDFIFHRPDLPRISPLVTMWWRGKVVRLLNLIPHHVWGNGNMPEGRCADFIAACFTLPQLDANRIEVCNVPIRREWLDDPDGFLWYRRLLADLQSWHRPPVLINLEAPFNATQGGVELCRRAMPWDGTGPLWVAAKRGRG